MGCLLTHLSYNTFYSVVLAGVILHCKLMSQGFRGGVSVPVHDLSSTPLNFLQLFIGVCV